MTDAFTAHNIVLDDGSETASHIGWLIANSPWAQSAIRVLETIYPNGLAGRRIVDLGCLEGGYTVEFARRGMDSLGIEARASNFVNCELVQRGLSLSNLKFAQDDVWNIAKYGTFDAVFCCGLLYHLERPTEFVRLLSSLCSKVLIINTHFSTQEMNNRFPLSEIVEQDGIKGRWFHEYEPGTKDLEALKWTAWSNHRSFWPLREYIPQMVRDAGFDLVFEQFDWLGQGIAESLSAGYYATHNRGMFVGIKTGQS